MFNRMDFTIRRDWENIVFRFYPKKSDLYVFTKSDKLSSNNIFSADYRWSLLEERKIDPQFYDKTGPKQEILKFEPDESSILVYLPELIDSFIKYPPEYEKQNFVHGAGMGSSEWNFVKYKTVEFKDEEDFEGTEVDRWQVQIYSMLTQRGYKFWLTEKELKDLRLWLIDINDYMLDHAKLYNED